MIKAPALHISNRALPLWKIYGLIQFGITLLLTVGLGVAIWLWSWPFWLMYLGVGITILDFIVGYWFIPKWTWRSWRYEVTDQDIEIQQGIIFKKKTLVPMVRVQHVDTEQGPLLRKYHLASISISTAATVHKIPGLDEDRAEELRLSISALARVAEEDV